MIKPIPVVEKDIFAFRITGRLTDEDYRQFNAELERILQEQGGPVSLLLELEGFQGWDPKALWAEFRFAAGHGKDFRRIAVVGEHRWQKWMTALGNAFSETEIRYFDRDALQAAWDWLRSPEEAPAQAEEENLEEKMAKILASPPPAYRHILVPTDFSPTSYRALARARELVKQYGARLSVIHAVESILYYDEFYDPIVPTFPQVEADEAIFDAAEQRMTRLAEQLNDPSIHTEVMWGTPKQVILSYAEAQQVDLIVMGTHGHHGLARLLGSTANGVMHNARCDVFTIRSEA